MKIDLKAIERSLRDRWDSTPSEHVRDTAQLLGRVKYLENVLDDVGDTLEHLLGVNDPEYILAQIHKALEPYTSEE